MPEEWLIDGYNLLHARASAGHSQHPQKRSELLAELAGFASLKGQPVVVVLDGKGEPGELETHDTKLFRVVYSQKVSADACIERTLYERRSTTLFTVVTNDRAIANIARGGGSRVMSCETFLETLKESGKESSDTLHKGRIRSHGFNRPFDDKLKDL
jgi:predicted RNA-binding protein with PIN domain